MEALKKKPKNEIHPTAIVGPRVKLGAGTRVWAFAQIREKAVIGRRCVIGNGAYIDTGVVVGDRCNIHNKALLYRNLCLEKDVFIGPAVCFVNDPAPRANRIRSLRGRKTIVRVGASVGAQAIIMPEVTVGKYSIVAAGAVVTRDVPDFALVKGSPSRVTGYVDRQGRRFAGSRIP